MLQELPAGIRGAQAILDSITDRARTSGQPGETFSQNSALTSLWGCTEKAKDVSMLGRPCGDPHALVLGAKPRAMPEPLPEPARRRGRWWSGNCPAGREGRQATVCPSTEPQALLIKGSVSHRFPAGPAMTSRFPSSSATADLENQQPRGKGGGRGSSLPLLPHTSRSISSWDTQLGDGGT